MLESLSIIIIYYRTPAVLQECLKRLEQHAPGATVLVVDNDSRDGCEARVRESFPEVTVLGASNHSMADAVNVGLAAVSTPYVAHMNADVWIEAGTFETLLSVLHDPDVGMVAPRCRTPSGSLQHQGLPYGRHYRKLARTSTSVEVPWLSGAIQVTKREVLERVGGMDSTFRFYNEDMDWCYRIRRAGYRCELVKTDVTHLGGSSTPASPRFLIEGYRGGFALSQRHASPLYRQAHYWFVRGFALFGSFFARSPQERAAFRGISSLFRERRFDESPFGATLAEENPQFLQDALSE